MWSTSTMLLHADGAAVGTSHDSDVSAPIGVSTTFERVAGDSEHIYSRESAPTRQRTEAVLSALEGGTALLYSSGLTAVHAAVSALMKEGKRRVRISGGYHGTHAALGTLDMEVAELGNDIRPGDIVWLETPKNPTGELEDIARYVATGADVVVDATLAPPPLQRPLTRGARMVVHSATKYLGGHSDLLGGVVAVQKEDPLLKHLIHLRHSIGTHAGSLETWLLLRSLRTLDLRVQRQSSTAATLAAWLRTQSPIVSQVHHAGDTNLARTQMNGVGGVFAIDLATESMARALPGTLRLFKDATSLGGVESLAEWRRRYDSAISPTLIRLSVGLEDSDDLITDFQQAFNILRSL